MFLIEMKFRSKLLWCLVMENVAFVNLRRHKNIFQIYIQNVSQEKIGGNQKKVSNVKAVPLCQRIRLEHGNRGADVNIYAPNMNNPGVDVNKHLFVKKLEIEKTKTTFIISVLKVVY